MKGMFRTLPLTGAPSVASLRLVGGKDLKLLLLTGMTESRALLVASLDGNNAVQPLAGVGVPSPSWDATGSDDGSLSFAFAVSESATVWLAYASSTEGRNTMVSRRYMSGLFGAPRFVKGGASLAISSVADVERTKGAVLFSREADGGYGEFKRLPAPDAGELLDARLIRSEQGYWLFMRFLPPSDGPRSTGFLYCSQLGTDFQETRPATRCLRQHEILEFDADAADGRAVVFATTPRGYVLAEGPDFDAPEETSAAPLNSPSVLLDANTVHIAAIEAVGSPNARIVIGTVPALP
jgi:hypothetical protein